MIGLIPRVLLDLITAAGGPTAAAEVRRRAGVSPEKRLAMSDIYDDAQWRRLFAATCEVLNVSQSQAEDLFAEHFLADALKRWPVWFQMSASARQLLERQPSIHNSLAAGLHDPRVRKSTADKFRIEKRDRELIAHYRSPNELCGLYKALARRVLTHYGERATVEETQCMKEGAGECVIHIRWTSEESQ